MSHKQVENQMITMMLYNIQSIYKNKSSDEYKMAGDITKSPEYNNIKKMIDDLKTLKHYPKNEENDIKAMFETLHKPIFKECVRNYLNESDERNALYTAMFTVGYRVLVGELARVYTCTEATDDGFVYKPNKIIRRSDVAAFIKSYNKDLNKRIDEYLEENNKSIKKFKESYSMDELDFLKIGEMYIAEDATGVINDIFNAIDRVHSGIIRAIGYVFKGFREINPISFINACLMHSYQKKVDTFHNTASMYEATKKAYDEYMKLPASKRKPEIEEKYRRNIEKYNIATENLRAKIKDYDQRAITEKERQEQEFPRVSPDSGPNAPSIPDNMYDEEEEPTSTNTSIPSEPVTTAEPTPQPTPQPTNGGLDF